MQATLVSCAPFWEANRDGSCKNSWLQSLLPHLRKVMTEAERSPMKCHLETLEGNRWLVVHGTVFPLSLTQVIYRKMSETLDRSLTKEASERISWTLQTVPCCFPQLGARGPMSVLLYFWVSVLFRSYQALLCMTAFHATKKTDLQPEVRKKTHFKSNIWVQCIILARLFLWAEYARNHS